MGTFTEKERKTIARNIRERINEQYPDKEHKQQLAQRLGVTPMTISQWAREKRTPDIGHLYQLSKALEIPLHQLCGLHKQPSSSKSDRTSKIIIKMASCTNNKGESFFHKIPRNKMPVAIGLIFKELDDIMEQSINALQDNEALKDDF